MMKGILGLCYPSQQLNVQTGQKKGHQNHVCQQIITCSKSAIETLETSVNYVQI